MRPVTGKWQFLSVADWGTLSEGLAQALHCCVSPIGSYTACVSCRLGMQVHPHCGDGVEISVLYWDSQKASTEVLHAAEYAVQQAPVRQRVLFFLDHLHTGALLCHLAGM